MNQSAAKATRREIRRAFGPQAVNAISETQQNTHATVQSVAFAHERLDALIADIGLTYDVVTLVHAITARVVDTEARYRLEGLGGEFARFQAETRAVHQRDFDIVAGELDRIEGLQKRTFFGRLRWLVSGR